MSALLLKSDTNVREFLMGTLWKLWVKAEWMNTEIYTHTLHQILFRKHRPLQVSGLRPFRLTQEITNEFRSTQTSCCGEQADWIVMDDLAVLL